MPWRTGIFRTSNTRTETKLDLVGSPAPKRKPPSPLLRLPFLPRCFRLLYLFLSSQQRPIGLSIRGRAATLLSHPQHSFPPSQSLIWFFQSTSADLRGLSSPFWLVEADR